MASLAYRGLWRLGMINRLPPAVAPVAQPQERSRAQCLAPWHMAYAGAASSGCVEDNYSQKLRIRV